MNMVVTYKAKSLEDIAGLFDQRAKQAREWAGREERKKHKERHMAEALAWENAASILRSTEMEKA